MQAVYAILDGPVLTGRGITLTQAAGSLLAGGLRLLQIRWKDNWTDSVYTEAQCIATMCREAGAMLVVNDRADVARLLGAGLHIGQEDLPPADVRAILGADCWIGFSTHNQTQFRAAIEEPVDYLALGPVFGTSSKRNPDPVVGVEELARLRPESPKPIVAIGGITLESAPAVWQAGADSVAIIGDLYPPGCTPASIRDRASEWTRIAHEHSGR